MPLRHPTASRLITDAADRAQRRLAQDLHDTVCQTFSGLNLLVRVLKRKMERWGPEAIAETEGVTKMIQQAVEELHEHVQWSQPRDFEEASLASALGTLAQATARRIPCTFEFSGISAPLDPDTAFHLFHLAREAVRNAVRHSKARKVTIRLRQEKATILSITDEGGGFDSKSCRRIPCSGLDLMRYRARLIGGTVRVNSKAGQGTTVTCRLASG
jgi:signal transduction histidine kinase